MMMEHDPTRVASALSYVSPDDRELWVRIAMAVKSELGESGFDVWDAWSQGAETESLSGVLNAWRDSKLGQASKSPGTRP